MLNKEKHMNSGIRKMKRYIKDNRVKKLKKLFEMFHESNLEHVFMKELDYAHGKRKRTYLHKSCANGNYLMVRTLLDFNADISCCDVDNNNILHYTLNYMLETCDNEYFKTTVLYLISISSQSMMEHKNKYGETAEELLSEVMFILNNKQTTFLLESDDETDEKDWNEKIFFEMASESKYDNENYAQDEFEDTFKQSKKESFSEWGDRIRGEYHAKHNAKKVESPKTENKRQEIKYGPNLVDDLRKKLKMFEIRECYEKSCLHIFTSDCETLQFKDIPWPISLVEDEIVENIDKVLDNIMELLIYGFNETDKLKYLKKQQVRWHPDRFLQKCGHRLHKDDKENILQMVNYLSQRINATVDSIL